jgi:protein-S-isoprenylcysteine O-methyltransferase Ste14
VGRVALSILGIAAYLGLAVLGWGGAAFFAHPARVALVLVTAALTVAALFTEGNLSRGVREDRGNRWALGAFVLLGLLDAYLPAWSDRRAVWPLGGALRLAAVFVLGRRFSGLVAIQPGHTLVTTGLYRAIRHPSYLGLLVSTLGWGMGFRSGIGVLLAALMLVPMLGRIAAEERLLRAEFGAEYDAYRARTARLVPGLF